MFIKKVDEMPSTNIAKNRISKIALILLALTPAIFLTNNVYAAQDFIIENKTSALFIVNGTTGNIIMAPSFGNSKVMFL